MTTIPQHRSIPAAFLLAAGSLFLLSTSHLNHANSSWLRNDSHKNDPSPRNLLLSLFADPKSVKLALRSDAYGEGEGNDSSAMGMADPTPMLTNTALAPSSQLPDDGDAAPDIDVMLTSNRMNCQIVFALGVEGAIHHGFEPILTELANSQGADPEYGAPYIIPSPESRLKKDFRRAVFNSLDGASKVEEIIKRICPADGRKRIYLENKSFPCGLKNRDESWYHMTPEEIAYSESALNSPTNLYDFYEAYSPYADIQFVVLHRPYLETIASHKRWDGGAETHSIVIQGIMLMLRQFLDTHMVDAQTGGRLWTVLCTDHLMSNNYENEQDLLMARQNVISHLASFLKWPNGECEHCFDDWRESTKNPVTALGKKNAAIVMEHAKHLEGVWPPYDDSQPGQQCRI